MAEVYAYLSFNGNCREAMTWYNEIFGGSLESMEFSTCPPNPEYPFPEEKKNWIMHSAIRRDGKTFLMASDSACGEFVEGNNVAVCVHFPSEDELKQTWEKISQDNRKVLCPLGQQFWGAIFGQFVDKFGIVWMLDHWPEGKKQKTDDETSASS